MLWLIGVECNVMIMNHEKVIAVVHSGVLRLKT